MKFALALLAVVAAQDDAGATEEGADQATCTYESKTSCEADAKGNAQRCAIMTINDFSVNQCVNAILCCETIEQDGQEMNFKCWSAAYRMVATAAMVVTAIASQQ